jgi:hypothetical protein
MVALLNRCTISPLLLAAGCLIAGLHGALHNQISYGASLEYFTCTKFPQFWIPAELRNRLGAAAVGFMAAWWMGLIIGPPLLLAGLVHRSPQGYAKHVLVAFGVCAATALVLGMGTLLWAHITLTPENVPQFGLPACVVDTVAYCRAGFMHDTSYLGGVVGIVTGVLYLLHAHRGVTSGESAATASSPSPSPPPPFAPRFYQSSYHMTTNPRMARKPQPSGFSLFLFKSLLVYAALAAALVATLVGNTANDDANTDTSSSSATPSPTTTQAALSAQVVVTVLIATPFVAVTLALMSFAVVTRCRLHAILQGFLWIERYNTLLKVRECETRACVRRSLAAPALIRCGDAVAEIPGVMVKITKG